MAESSLFAQRLQAITERRRLQDRILAIRRELEEERLRAQRLKRKSLRDRWLMEGVSAPTDDNDHMSSVWEAQARIQGLEQDLSSLQSQMQQLDNTELHQGQRQPEESVKALKEVKQTSLHGTGEVDGKTSSSPGGRSSTESRLELAPVPPKRPVRAAAKEKLQNGDMAGVGVLGRECSPGKANVKVSPVAAEGEDAQRHPGRSEAAPAAKPACQSSDPSEAPAGHQRKLAVEEMVIRDHLGQEVGSMDAVGQKQRSIGKEEELEGHTGLGNGALGQEEAPRATESQLDGELGSRDGPEGESPTSRDQQSPSKALQEETSGLDSPKRQADGELETGSLAKEAALMGAERKELPELGAKALEPARDLTVADAPAAEPGAQGQENRAGKQGLQELQGPEAIVLREGRERQESWQDQPKPSFPDQIPPAQEAKVPNSPEEATLPLLHPATSSSLPEQIPLQDQLPSQQDAKGLLLDQIPSSFQQTAGLLPEPVLPLLANPCPSTLLDQTPPLQGSRESPLAQIPSSLQEPLLEANPPSRQGHLSSSLEQKPSSLQGETTSPQEAKCSLLDQIPTPLCEANGKLLDQVPTALQEQCAAVPVQILSPLPDQPTALPGQILPSLHETEISLPISTTLQGQELEAKGSLPEITLSLTNRPSSLTDRITALQEAEGLSLEEIPVAVQDQMPPSPEARNPSLPEADNVLLGQVPSPVDDGKQSVPGETLTPVPDQLPLALQDQKPTSPEGTTPPSLQEAKGALPDQIMALPPNQTLPHLPGAKGSPQDQAQLTLAEQMPTSLKGQEELLPEKPVPPSLLEETLTLPDQAPSPNKAQSPTLQDVTTLPDVLPLSSREPAQPLLDEAATVENWEPKEDGCANLNADDTAAAAAAEEETTEVLETLHAEQQPLLNEAKASVTPPDISTGDQQPNAGIVKLQAAASQEAPTYTTTSANTASSCQLQPAVPRQEEDQEQGRRKQKSCQCCSVM